MRRAPTLERLAQAEPRAVWQKHDAGPLSSYILGARAPPHRSRLVTCTSPRREPCRTRGAYSTTASTTLGCDGPKPAGEGAFRDWGRSTRDGKLLSGREHLRVPRPAVFSSGRNGITPSRGTQPVHRAHAVAHPAPAAGGPVFPGGVCLEMPGFRVNEGPSVLIRGGKVYTYLLRQRDGRALYAVGFS